MYFAGVFREEYAKYCSRQQVLVMLCRDGKINIYDGVEYTSVSYKRQYVIGTQVCNCFVFL